MVFKHRGNPYGRIVLTIVHLACNGSLIPAFLGAPASTKGSFASWATNVRSPAAPQRVKWVSLHGWSFRFFSSNSSLLDGPAYTIDVSMKKPETSTPKQFFNPFPKYLQVREALKRRLRQQYDLGQQLPTEAALGQEFGVSRETIREALRGLEQEGLIARQRAKGTFYIRKLEESVGKRLTGMVEDFTALKLNTYAKVLTTGLAEARDSTAIPGSSVESIFCIRRLRYFEEEPLVLHEAYLPMAVGEQVAQLPLDHCAITQLIEDVLKLPMLEQQQQIEATIADTENAGLLEIGIGAPILLVRRLFRILYKTDDYALCHFNSYYRSDRYYYTLNLLDDDPT